MMKKALFSIYHRRTLYVPRKTAAYLFADASKMVVKVPNTLGKVS